MSPKLAINAAVVVASIVIAAVVNAVAVPEWVAVTGTVAAAIVVPLGAQGALEQAFGLLPEDVRKEIVAYTAVTVTALTTINATVVKPSTAITVGLAVLVALSGAIGGRSQATPVVDPRDDEGRPLVPAI